MSELAEVMSHPIVLRLAEALGSAHEAMAQALHCAADDPVQAFAIIAGHLSDADVDDDGWLDDFERAREVLS